MPSASLKNRLKALEDLRGQVDDSLYWEKVLAHQGPFMHEFGRAIKGEISLEEWEKWQAENPHPERGSPPTAEEERQAESAWAEFWEKIEQTRERLLSGAAMGLLNNPGEAKKEVDT